MRPERYFTFERSFHNRILLWSEGFSIFPGVKLTHPDAARDPFLPADCLRNGSVSRLAWILRAKMPDPAAQVILHLVRPVQAPRTRPDATASRDGQPRSTRRRGRGAVLAPASWRVSGCCRRTPAQRCESVQRLRLELRSNGSLTDLRPRERDRRAVGGMWAWDVRLWICCVGSCRFWRDPAARHPAPVGVPGLVHPRRAPKA